MIDPMSIYWELINQMGAWYGAFTSIVFSTLFNIPGLGDVTIWSIIVNPVTFITLFLAVVLKKVVPVF